MTLTYFYRDTTSDFTGSPSTIGNFAATRDPGGASSQINTGNLNSGVTASCFFFTEPGDPGTDGTSTGSFVVELRIDIQNANIGIRVYLQRFSSGGATMSSQIEATEGSQTADAATRQYNWTNPNLGTWAAGDRLGVRVQFTNISGLMNQSCRLGANLSSDTIITPFSAGVTTHEGTGSGSYMYSGAGAGTASPSTAEGTAAGSYTYTGAGAGSASAPGVLVEDDFNRANSDTVGNDSEGNAWVEASGDWDISSNGVIQTNANSVPGLLRCGTNIASDHWVEATLAASNGSGQVGFCLRVHATAFTGVFMEIADGAYKVIQVTNGEPDTVSVGSLHAHTTGERYRAESEGTTVRLFLNDTQVHTFTTSFAAGNTRVGLHLNESASGAVRFDNFRAGTLPYTAPSNDVTGTAAGSYTYSGVGAGVATPSTAEGTAAGSYTYAGVGAGIAVGGDVEGSATGSYTYSGVGAGVASPSTAEGTAAGSYTYAGIGVGEGAPTVVNGTAVGTYTHTGTAAGVASPTTAEGSAVGSYTYAGTAAGTATPSTVEGAAAGSYLYAGTGTGEGAPTVVNGTAAGTYTYAGTGAGAAAAGTFEGTGSATYIHSGLAAGTAAPGLYLGTATGIYTYTGGAFLAPPIPDPGWPVTLVDATQTVTLIDPPQTVMLVDADSTVSLVDATQNLILSDSDNAVAVTDPDQTLVF